MFLAAPAIVILLTLAPAFGSSTAATMTLLGVLMSAASFRLTRNCVREVRDELYVDAARVSGLSDRRIIARHIARVVRGPLIIAASMTAGIAIVVQAGLRVPRRRFPAGRHLGSDVVRRLQQHQQVTVADLRSRHRHRRDRGVPGSAGLGRRGHTRPQLGARAASHQDPSRYPGPRPGSGHLQRRRPRPATRSSP
ncbi:ABC transporter permease subunit [Yinghuangia aomiensis]